MEAACRTSLYVGDWAAFLGNIAIFIFYVHMLYRIIVVTHSKPKG
jgi:hypothetical protein